MFLLLACTTTDPSTTPLNEPGDWLDGDTAETVVEDTQSTDTDTTTDTGTPEDTSVEPFQPLEGSWIVTDGGTVEDGCGVDLERGEPGATMTLTHDGDQRLLLGLKSGELDCSLDGADYSCQPTETVDSTAQDLGFNASLLVEMETEGSFQDEDAMVMGTDATIDCDGPDCLVIAILLGSAFPCSVRIESTLAAQ